MCCLLASNKPTFRYLLYPFSSWFFGIPEDVIDSYKFRFLDGTVPLMTKALDPQMQRANPVFQDLTCGKCLAIWLAGLAGLAGLTGLAAQVLSLLG